MNAAVKHSTPAPDPATFRTVLGNLPTGVTVVTTATDEGPTGMACNSFTSVSLDPPLVSFCPAKGSRTWAAIRESGRFCVNVMAGDHEDTCRRFAQRGLDRFAAVAVVERPGGPGLADAIAWIDCEVHDVHEAGDHLIVVGAVFDIEARGDRGPLVFFRGKYGSFIAAGETPAPVDGAEWTGDLCP